MAEHERRRVKRIEKKEAQKARLLSRDKEEKVYKVGAVESRNA